MAQKDADQPVELDPQELLSLSPDDVGNALSVLQLYPGKFIYIDEMRTGGWMYYTGSHWREKTAEARVTYAIRETLKARHILAVKHEREAIAKKTWGDDKLISAARRQLKHMVTRSIEAFDTDPDLLNCKNGVVNLRTGELIPHSPEQLFTYCLPVDYDPEADSTGWVEFLREVIADPDNVIPFLQQAVGYTLTGRTWEEKLFYLYGPARAGKGTFTETLLTLLGEPLASGAQFDSLTRSRDGDSNRADLASFRPCRYVTASESSRYTSLNPAVIKQLTGGDTIKCAHKYGKHFNYRPQYKIWVSSNWPISVDVDDDAAWSRVHVIEFPNGHLGKEDKQLKRRLISRDNLRGVLAWAVAGAKEWYATKDGLQTPDSVRISAERQRAELDTVQQFLDECVDPAPGGLLPNAVMYQNYEKWCQDNGVTPHKQKSFTQSLHRKGYEQKRARVSNKVQRCWVDCDIPLPLFERGEDVNS